MKLKLRKKKKPFILKLIGVFFFFLFIWFSYGFKFKENRAINLNQTENKIIKNYLNKVGLDNLNIKYIERKNYSLIYFDNNQPKTIQDYLWDPFFFQQENCYAQRYIGNKKNIIFKNLNLKELFLNYQKLTGQNLSSFLDNENLVNNFSSQQENNLLSIFNNPSDGILDIELNKINYLIRVKINKKDNLKKQLNNFEKTISYILSSFYPETKELVLPDQTIVKEVVVHPEKFSFQNSNTIRYIKNEKLNFILAYQIDGDTILFSSSFLGLKGLIPKFKSCDDEGVLIVPKKFIKNVGILKIAEFQEYQKFIFIKKENRPLLILKK